MPVVAATATGATTLVRDGQTGLLVEPGDADSYAEGVAAKLAAGLVMLFAAAALILASLGLLEGRRATTNWFFSGLLDQFGARYRRQRWVHDGNIIMSAVAPTAAVHTASTRVRNTIALAIAM